VEGHDPRGITCPSSPTPGLEGSLSHAR
jgi:hypothetical protein